MHNRAFAVLVSVVLASIAGAAQTTAGMGPSALFQKGMNALQGSSASRSTPDSMEYFRRSAELGFAPAQDVLGYIYETGFRTTTPDPREALDWYRKAAQQGDPLAQWLVGRMIYLGEVPPRDLNDASSWLEKSNQQGNPFAQFLLGKIALERSHYAHAADLFRQAAEQGLPQAQFQLALLLRDGQGAPLDKVEAFAWMLVSYDQGLRFSATVLQALEAELSSTELEQAKSKASGLEGSAIRSVAGHGCTGWPGEFNDVPAPPPPDTQRFCH